MTPTPIREGSRLSPITIILLALGAAGIIAILIWQGLTAQGAPDPLARNVSPGGAMLSAGILVFREGLEAILVLAAITAGIIRNRHSFWRSVLLGVWAALAATVATWFIVVAIISAINAPMLHIQAATGLLAIIVLLVVMNWFFHKIYWTGWISHHSKRRKEIMERADSTPAKVAFGLAMLGFTAIYREGFEIVLFLQDLRLKVGNPIVLSGAGIGLVLTIVAGALTFYAHKRLPYKKMLVLTGVMLAGVLIVMVGESAQELQLAGWMSETTLNLPVPDWMGTWFALFPNVEGLVSQFVAALLVGGSYAWVRRSVPKAEPEEKAAPPMASLQARSPKRA